MHLRGGRLRGGRLRGGRLRGGRLRGGRLRSGRLLSGRLRGGRLRGRTGGQLKSYENEDGLARARPNSRTNIDKISTDKQTGEQAD